MRHVGLLGGSIQAPTKYAFPTFEGPSNPHVLQSEIEASSSASLASSERRRLLASDMVEFTLRYPFSVSYMLDLMIIERHVHCSRGLLIRLGHGKAGKRVYDWLMQKRRLELVVAAGDSKNILSHSC